MGLEPQSALNQEAPGGGTKVSVLMKKRMMCEEVKKMGRIDWEIDCFFYFILGETDNEVKVKKKEKFTVQKINRMKQTKRKEE